MQSAAKDGRGKVPQDVGKSLQIEQGEIESYDRAQRGIPASRRQDMYHNAAETTQDEVTADTEQVYD